MGRRASHARATAAEGPMARMKPYVAFIIKSIAVFAVVTILHVAGALDFIDNELSDMRFSVARSEATDRLVLVKVDAASLDQVGVWPWPRSLYADLLDRLFAAGAEDVALDIDFSSESVRTEDTRLAEALSRYGPRVILPVFKQPRQTSDVNLVHQANDVNFIYTQPLPQFRAHTRLASLNIFVVTGGPRLGDLEGGLVASAFTPTISVVSGGAERESASIPSTSTMASARTRSRSFRSPMCCTATSIRRSCAAITSSSARARRNWATASQCRSRGPCPGSSSRPWQPTRCCRDAISSALPSCW